MVIEKSARLLFLAGLSLQKSQGLHEPWPQLLDKACLTTLSSVETTQKLYKYQRALLPGRLALLLLRMQRR